VVATTPIYFEKTCPTVFVVRNIAAGNKTIRIFGYPILNGVTRDVMAIPHVSEDLIRHHLLKGELKNKLEYGEAWVVESKINLLQFDVCQKNFLSSHGVTVGLDATGAIPFIFKQGMSLVGVKNGTNRIFTTVDKFVQGTLSGNTFKISIKHNGRVLAETIDYIVSESGGAGTGYDTVVFVSFAPQADSTIVVDYMVEI
jgi:hypothetical protein